MPFKEVEKWQWLIDSLRHLVMMSGEISVYAYEIMLNFELMESSLKDLMKSY